MELDVGWLMIIIGLLLLIIEASQPGFFVAVLEQYLLSWALSPIYS